MKAMIFAAGLGTRLRPITDSMPKALVPVGGIPMLQRVIMNLKNAGCSHIIVNVHHFPDMIIDFLAAHDNFGIEIAVSDERHKLLDTGGGIVKVASWLDGNEPFIVHNADILTDLNLRELYDAHCNSRSDATLLVSSRKTSRYLLFDNDMKMNGWINDSTGEVKPAGTNATDFEKYAFNGIHVLSPSALHELTSFRKEGEAFSIMDFYIDACRHLNFNGFLPDAQYSWFDIGKQASLTAAETHLTN